MHLPNILEVNISNTIEKSRDYEECEIKGYEYKWYLNFFCKVSLKEINLKQYLHSYYEQALDPLWVGVSMIKCINLFIDHTFVFL